VFSEVKLNEIMSLARKVYADISVSDIVCSIRRLFPDIKLDIQFGLIRQVFPEVKVYIICVCHNYISNFCLHFVRMFFSKSRKKSFISGAFSSVFHWTADLELVFAVKPIQNSIVLGRPARILSFLSKYFAN
jgi:hypothetical protein